MADYLMKFFTHLILIILIINTNELFAQNSIWEDLSDDGTIFLDDGISYFSYPVKMSSNEWILAGSTALGTYGLMYFDNDLMKKLSFNNKETLNGDFWDVPTKYGIVQYMNIGALSVYAVGLISREDEIRKLGRMIFQSLSYTGISVMAIRIAAGRERPYSGFDPFTFNGFTLDNEIQSFPSGHTTVAFAVSSAIAEYYNKWWLKIGMYGFASLTAYARIRNKQHWTSDVIFGALLGITGGLHTAAQQKIREGKSEENNFSVIPSFNSISLVYRIN